MEKMEKQIVMEKEFVPNQLALKMKALGFDEPCIACYTQNAYGSNKDQKIQYWHSPMDGNNDYVFVFAPTWQSAFKWFREKYGLHTWIYQIDNGKFFFSSLKNGRYIVCNSIEFTTYEEAELSCLTELIEIIENEKML